MQVAQDSRRRSLGCDEWHDNAEDLFWQPLIVTQGLFDRFWKSLRVQSKCSCFRMLLLTAWCALSESSPSQGPAVERSRHDEDARGHAAKPYPMLCHINILIEEY